LGQSYQDIIKSESEKLSQQRGLPNLF